MGISTDHTLFLTQYVKKHTWRQYSIRAQNEPHTAPEKCPWLFPADLGDFTSCLHWCIQRPWEGSATDWCARPYSGASRAFISVARVCSPESTQGCSWNRRKLQRVIVCLLVWWSLCSRACVSMPVTWSGWLGRPELLVLMLQSI